MTMATEHPNLLRKLPFGALSDKYLLHYGALYGDFFLIH